MCGLPTCGETSFLMTFGKFNIEKGDKGMYVVIPSHLEVEFGGERQIFLLHSVDVNFLQQQSKLHV